MGRIRLGTLEARPNGEVVARVTVTVRDASGQLARRRPRIPIGRGTSSKSGRLFVEKLSTRLRDRVLTEEEYQRLVSGHALESGHTVREFAAEMYLPTRRKHQSHARQVQWWDLHILPVIGDVDVRLLEARDLRRLVQQLDAKVADTNQRFSWKTAVNVWGLVTKFCSDLASSKLDAIRIRDDNPARDVAGPDRGRKKKHQWLYPVELQKLLSCQDVPVRWRRLYALQTYLFARPGEIPPLDFVHNIDLEHGMVTIDRKQDLRTGEIDLFTKADGEANEVRSFPLEPILIPLLQAMQQDCGGQGRLFKSCDDGAATLRRHLRIAGVNRPALHQKTSEGSMPIRQHDLRATGISYLALRGDSDDDVRERAGHSDFETTLRYLRRGKRVSGQVGDPFAALPECLLHDPGRISLDDGGYRDRQGRLPSRRISPQITSSAESSPSILLTNLTTYSVRRRGLEPPRELPH